MSFHLKVFFYLKMFSAKRLPLALFLCLCITGSIGLAAESSTTRTLDNHNHNHKQKSDTKQTFVGSEISPPANIDFLQKDKFIDKRQLRHDRFHKLDYLFKKLSKTKDFAKRQVDYSDIPIDNASELVLKSHQYESKSIDKYATSRSIQTPEAFTENPRKILARSVPSHQELRVRHSEDFGDEEEEDIIDDYDENEEEDYDEEREEQIRMLHDEIEQKPQKLSDLVNHYIMSDDRWSDRETEADFSNDDPSQEDYDSEWEYGPQSDASDGPVTEKKWVYYGTRTQLESHSKRSHRVKQEDINAAIQHTMLMRKEGVCKVPQKRIVSVQSIHPNPSKQYIPSCTFLHRCGDDTGCCMVEAMTCAPKSTHKVELHFYTAIVGHERTVIEKLSFINHTECECIHKREEFMVKDETSTFSPRPFSHRVYDDFEQDTPQPFKRCQCPAEYSVHILDDGECACDCSNKQRDCMRIKRGKEYFSLKDRLCIQNGQCQTPNCEFGTYINKLGRCPKKQGKEESSKHPQIFGK